MKTALVKGLERLDVVRAIESQPPVEFQIGYVKRLPEEFAGERHVVTVGRAADGTYGWEERLGAPPASEDSPTSIIRIFLVRAKDGRPTSRPLIIVASETLAGRTGLTSLTQISNGFRSEEEIALEKNAVAEYRQATLFQGEVHTPARISSCH